MDSKQIKALENAIQGIKDELTDEVLELTRNAGSAFCEDDLERAYELKGEASGLLGARSKLRRIVKAMKGGE